MATVGTGIGGGIVVGGGSSRGGFGLAGEFGHLVVAPGGRRCGCGARGCLEAYASGTALTGSVRAAAEADPRTRGTLFERAGGDLDRIDGPPDHEARARGRSDWRCRALAELGEWLGRGLAQVAAVLDPELVLVGGGLAEAAGDLLPRPGSPRVRRRAEHPRDAPVRAAAPAALGNAAGLVGAATLARAASARRGR